jgi:hypothetical protein
MVKLPALLLLVLGVIWGVFLAWFNLVMSGIAEPEYPMPIMYLLGVADPLLLIVGSVMALTHWHPRVGAIFCAIGCAWLTWSLGAMIFDTYSQPVLHPNNAIESPYTFETSIYVATEAAFFVIADVAAIVLLLRTFHHLTKRSSQPLAGA